MFQLGFILLMVVSLTENSIFSGSGSEWQVKEINDSDVLVGARNIAFSYTDESQVIVPDGDFFITDVNNNNAYVGYESHLDSALVATPISSEQEIIIDGSFDDWEGVTRFIDSAEDGGTVNWYEVWADDDIGSLSFSYSTFSYSHILNPINENDRHLWSIYLDTDKQSTTGYNFELLGADYLVQGKNLYQYTGTGKTGHGALLVM